MNTYSFRIVSTFLLLFLNVAAAAADDAASSTGPRKWTDATKKHTVEATFLGIHDDKVSLQKENGDTVEVPLAKLSAESQKLAKSLQAKIEKSAGAGNEDPFATPSNGELSVQEIARRAEKAIVLISSRNVMGETVVLGSGFVIASSGLVATNYHVIKDASSASVRFRDGSEAVVAGYRALDKKRDLAILQLASVPKGVSALAFAPPDEVKQGDAIIAVGHPAGFEFSVTSGIVSAVRKTAELPQTIQQYMKTDPECTWIQITAQSAPGSSGGPLLDHRGRVLGVVSWLVPQQNIGFAVHAKHLADLKKTLAAKANSLPVPGSFQGPGISEPKVLAALAALHEDLTTMYSRLNSVEGVEKKWEIYETENPIPKHIPNFRRLAESKPGTRQEFEALITILRLAHDESPQSKEGLRWAFQRLLEQYSGSELLGGLMFELSRIDAPETPDFIRQVIAKSPYKEVRGRGYFALGLALRTNSRTRGRGDEEAIAAWEKALADYGPLELGEWHLKDLVEPMLQEAKWLEVGRTAPDIEGKDSGGKPFRLSDYRGKAVLLDFWVDWCPYCRAMYPQEKSLASRNAGKPFAILGVNCDESSRLVKTEAEGRVAWRSWADGQSGPIARQWQISGYPTVYLIDREGRIRRKGFLHGEVLEKAVASMVTEAKLGAANDLIAPASVWTYFDGAKPVDAGWQGIEFDDSGWKSGRGLFGAGIGDETTPLATQSQVGPKSPTTCFRRTFTVQDPAKVPGLLLGLTYADGAAVYLNGREIMRLNLPAGAKREDPARTQSPDHGLACRFIELSASALCAGNNVIAVEVHSRVVSQSGARFDLSLSTTKKKRSAIANDALEMYIYDGGAFTKYLRDGKMVWMETKVDSSKGPQFVETARDNNWISIFDSGRRMTVRLPVGDGMCSFSRDDGKTWNAIYYVNKAK